MPELDPNWEYYTPDPEILEVMGDGNESVSNYDRVVDDRLYKNGCQGIRFGSGDPNRVILKEAKEKVIENRLLERKICKQCGYSFQPKRGTRVYCSRECKSKSQVKHTNSRIGSGKRKVWGESSKCKICKVCNKSYEPTSYIQKVCSNLCATKSRTAKFNSINSIGISNIETLKGMYDNGTKVKEIAALLGITVNTVKVWRRKLGISPRGPRGRVVEVV
jgi:transposase-like protein